jgi:hypothetical protein
MRRICTIAAFAAAFAVFVPACAFAAGWSHMIPIISEANGFIASTLVLATFTMKDMRMLRIVAIFSNIAFITYAALDWLLPVLTLHLMLLPLNLLRLRQLVSIQIVSTMSDQAPVLRHRGPSYWPGCFFRGSTELNASVVAAYLDWRLRVAEVRRRLTRSLRALRS